MSPTRANDRSRLLPGQVKRTDAPAKAVPLVISTLRPMGSSPAGIVLPRRSALTPATSEGEVSPAFSVCRGLTVICVAVSAATAPAAPPSAARVAAVMVMERMVGMWVVLLGGLVFGTGSKMAPVGTDTGAT